MFWIFFIGCCYHALPSTGYVLLAANLEDFSRLANSFGQFQITNDSGSSNSTDESRNTEEISATSLDQDETEETDELSIRRSRTQNTHNKKNKNQKATVLEMNLDDLVERVKEKLRDELTEMVISNRTAAETVIKLSSKENTEENVNMETIEQETTKTTPKIVIKHKQAQRKPTPNDLNDKYETETPSTKRNQGSRTTTRRRLKKRKENKKKTPDDTNGEFEGFSLTGKHDSYEEYQIPKKDDEDNVYDTEPTEYVRKGEVATTEAIELDDVEEETSVRHNKKLRPSPKILPLVIAREPKKTETFNFDSPPLSYAEQLVQATTDSDVYEDETTTISIFEIGSRTANINFDEAQESEEITIEETIKEQPKNGTKKKRVSSATMIPKRDFYTISTPNILAKLPRIAEKYNFDEPLPEKDREPENLRDVGNPPASINGKERLLK